MIFFTSGSTGPAKGVTHSGETLRWMMTSAIAAFGLTEEDAFLPGSSMSHLGSFLWSLCALSVGARVVSTELLTEFAALAGFPIDEGYGMTEVGYLWFFGRKKQVIVHDGSNISPFEVEGRCWSTPPSTWPT